MDEMIETQLYAKLIIDDNIPEFCKTLLERKNSLAAIKWDMEVNVGSLSHEKIADFLMVAADYIIGQYIIIPDDGEGEEHC